MALHFLHAAPGSKQVAGPRGCNSADVASICVFYILFPSLNVDSYDFIPLKVDSVHFFGCGL